MRALSCLSARAAANVARRVASGVRLRGNKGQHVARVPCLLEFGTEFHETVNESAIELANEVAIATVNGSVNESVTQSTSQSAKQLIRHYIATAQHRCIIAPLRST